MGGIFISHSSRNNAQAIEVRDWLKANGWRDIFLDLDPEQGIAPGERWLEELRKAGERCSAVVALLSPDWLASDHCRVEVLLSAQNGKCVLGAVIVPMPREKWPTVLTAHFQLFNLFDPATRAEDFERLRFGLKRAGLGPGDFQWPPPEQPGRPAYRGLRALEEIDAGVFFGRDAPITRGLDCLRRMRDGAPERILVILGASGAGKSSFLKAGLLARLLRDEENFLVLPTMRPQTAALSGSMGLLRALDLSAWPGEEDLAARLATIRRPVIERLKTYAAAARETFAAKLPTLVLPIDQAEELFSSDNPESGEALDLLRAACAADGNLVVVLTIRSDSYSQLQVEPRIAALPRALFDLPRLSPGAFKEVIEGPGRLANPKMEVEPALTERLLAEVDTSDALPLLAFALERLATDYGGDGKLELHDFVEGLGGFEGAIEKAVEAALAAARRDPELPSGRAELEALARRAFLPWLVNLTDFGSPAKRRVAMNDLPPDARRFVRHMVDQRLLVSDLLDGQPMVEVSHEAVLRHWRELKSWIQEERERLRILGAVQTAAEEWHRHALRKTGPAESWLVHRGARLSDAELLLGRPDYSLMLGDSGREYLLACRRQEGRLQRRARAALSLIVLAVISFAVFAVVQTRSASRQVSSVLVDAAQRAITDGENERAMRLATLAAREGILTAADPAAAATLTGAASRSALIGELDLGPLAGVQASPSGELLLTWDAGGTIRVRQAETGAEIGAATLDGNLGGASFDVSGKRILAWAVDWGDQPDSVELDPVEVVEAGSGRGQILVLNAATGATMASVEQDGEIKNVQFDASGERVLFLSWDGRPQVLEVATNRTIPGPIDKCNGASFDRSGSRVLSWTWGSEMVHVWNTATGEIAAFRHEGEVSGATFDPTGRRVLSWSSDGLVQVWNPQTKIAKVASGKINPAFDPRLGSTGNLVLSFEPGGHGLHLWNIETDEEIHLEIDSPEEANLDLAGEGVFAWGESGFGIWNLKGELLVESPAKEGTTIRGALFDTSGKRVLYWGDDGIARVWDIGTRSEKAASKRDGEVVGAAFVAEGTRVLSWNSLGTGRLWSASSGGELAVLRHDRQENVDYEAVGGPVFSWDEAGIVRFWNDLFGIESAAYPAVHGYVWRARFDAAGARILSWEVDPPLVDGSEITLSQVFQLASESVKGVARVLDAATGKEIASTPFVEGDSEWAKSSELLAESVFDGTKHRELSISGNTAQVRDTATGADLVVLHHEREIWGGAIDPEGRRVLLWDDREYHIWDVSWSIPRKSNGVLIDEVCAHRLKTAQSTGGGAGANLRKSVRRITEADASFAPILKLRKYGDVCP